LNKEIEDLKLAQKATRGEIRTLTEARVKLAGQLAKVKNQLAKASKENQNLIKLNKELNQPPSQRLVLKQPAAAQANKWKVGTKVYARKDVGKGGFGNGWFGRKEIIAKALKGHKGDILANQGGQVTVRWWKCRKNGRGRPSWIIPLSACNANLSLKPIPGHLEREHDTAHWVKRRRLPSLERFRDAQA